MFLSFFLDPHELNRWRTLNLHNTTRRIPIPNEPRYQPVRNFVNDIETNGGYRFRLFDLLHATGFQMFMQSLNWTSASTPIELPFLAAGGLYLALELSHNDLCLRSHLGDFLSGFSHQVGVGMTMMVASQSYGIPWDRLVPVRPTSRRKTLDFSAALPDGTQLYVEAKGTTSDSSRYQMKRSGEQKKVETRELLSPAEQMRTAMLVIITQVAKESSRRGSLTIVDPPFDIPEDAYSERNLEAGRYLHYAAAANFAGLPAVAQELVDRARALRNREGRPLSFRRLEVRNGTSFTQMGTQLIGCQWQLGDELPGQRSLWLYHGVEQQRLQAVVAGSQDIQTLSFPVYSPDTQYSPYWSSIERGRNKVRLFNLHTSGSFFGIGTDPLPGVTIIDPRAENLGLEAPLATVE